MDCINDRNKTMSIMQKRVNTLTKKVSEAQNGSARKTKIINQYRGFISDLLNKEKITKNDIILFFGNSQGPKVKTLNK